MKKIFLATVNLMAVALFFDINNILKLYQFRDGTGIGIYVLGGIVEINDKVPYKNVPVYIAVLAGIVLSVILLDVYIVYRNKSNAK